MHNEPQLPRHILKKKSIVGHKEVVNFLKYIYLLLFIAYSDLKEADTDCYSQ